MEPTQRMYEVMKEHNPAARNVMAGLREALKDVPEVEPFTFEGGEGLHVYLHGCGAVLDVDPAMKNIDGSVWSDIEAGECDCENTSPWMRIYVLKEDAPAPAPNRAQQLLALPLPDNDADAATVQDYLLKLISVGMEEKRPFGNSGWIYELFAPMMRAGMISGQFDEDGFVEECDSAAGHLLLAEAIEELRK